MSVCYDSTSVIAPRYTHLGSQRHFCVANVPVFKPFIFLQCTRKSLLALVRDYSSTALFLLSVPGLSLPCGVCGCCCKSGYIFFCPLLVWNASSFLSSAVHYLENCIRVSTCCKVAADLAFFLQRPRCIDERVAECVILSHLSRFYRPPDLLWHVSLPSSTVMDEAKVGQSSSQLPRTLL